MHMAARGGHGAIVEALLEAGADPDIRFNGAWSPLAFAAEHSNDHGCDTRAVAVLLKAGADPLLEDWNGYTALTRAECDVVYDLIQEEADEDKYQRQPPPEAAVREEL